jgi:arginyl-tRNA synthetase
MLNDMKAGDKEVELVKLIRRFPDIVSEAGAGYSPALIANYCYELSKEYNQFYHDFSILGESEIPVRNFRLALSWLVSSILNSGMWLLGIEMPERM